jgi:hypothetical protein
MLTNSDVLDVLLTTAGAILGVLLGGWLTLRSQRWTVTRERQHERETRLIEAIVDVQQAMLHEPGMAEMMNLEAEESRAPMLKATRRLALWGGDDAGDTLADLAFEASSGTGDWHKGSAMFQGWARTATAYVRGAVTTRKEVREAYNRHAERWLTDHQ